MAMSKNIKTPMMRIKLRPEGRAWVADPGDRM